MYFAKDDSGILHKVRDDGSTRTVTADDPCYLAWLDQGGVLGDMPVAPVPTLEEVQAQACARLNAKRDAIQYGTFTDSHGHPYDVDSRGREKMTGLEAKIANGLTLPEGFSWTGADNEEYPHDTASFLALTTEILIWTSTVHGVCVGAKAAVRAAETVEAVKAAEAAVVWP